MQAGNKVKGFPCFYIACGGLKWSLSEAGLLTM